MDPLVTLLKSDYKVIKHKLKCLEESGVKVVPHSSEVLSVFEGLTFNKIKVVILSQNSEPTSTKLKQLDRLPYWKTQGVLAFSRVLTSEEGNVNAHNEKLGWEEFTNKIIKLISDHRLNVVFILCGEDAQEVENLIDPKKHLILKRGGTGKLKNLFNSKHLLECNIYLKNHNVVEIDW